MVKPALPYLDIIARLRPQSLLPIAAYQVSGEYAMIKFAAAAGALDEQRVCANRCGAIKRAGADLHPQLLRPATSCGTGSDLPRGTARSRDRRWQHRKIAAADRGEPPASAHATVKRFSRWLAIITVLAEPSPKGLPVARPATRTTSS